MNRLLVVNADDLGLTRGVNRAIRRAHLDGVVTSTSLLAVGSAFDDAAKMLKQTPTLDLGAHLAMVGEDPPLLTAHEIPTLVDATGRFPLSYRTVVARALARRIDPADVQREFTAQLERITQIGVPLTHLDTHQHVHLWPSIGKVVAQLALTQAIPVVRVPRSRRMHPIRIGVNLLSTLLRRQVSRAGLRTTGDYAGLDEAGLFFGPTFTHTMRTLAEASKSGGAVEINSHPGEVTDDLDRFEWGYHWAEELAQLTDPDTRALIEELGFRTVSFSALNTPPA